MDQATAFVRWPGGKRRLVPRLRSGLPANVADLRYVDPFLGGGALYFDLAPKRALLSDACRPLILAYQTIADSVALDLLIARLQALQAFARPGVLRANYQHVKASINAKMKDPCAAPHLVAADFLWLNRMTFNGLWRVNSRGEFSASVDGSRVTRQITVDVVRSALLRRCSAALQGAEVLHQDFRATLAQAGAGDFVFADAPYVPSVQTTWDQKLKEWVPDRDLVGVKRTASFTGWTAGGWDTRDTADLFDGLRRAADRGAFVMATNHDAPEVRELAAMAGLRVEEVEVHRSISCNATTRGPTREVILTRTP